MNYKISQFKKKMKIIWIFGPLDETLIVLLQNPILTGWMIIDNNVANYLVILIIEIFEY